VEILANLVICYKFAKILPANCLQYRNWTSKIFSAKCNKASYSPKISPANFFCYTVVGVNLLLTLVRWCYYSSTTRLHRHNKKTYDKNHIRTYSCSYKKNHEVKILAGTNDEMTCYILVTQLTHGLHTLLTLTGILPVQRSSKCRRWHSSWSSLILLVSTLSPYDTSICPSLPKLWIVALLGIEKSECECVICCNSSNKAANHRSL